MSEGAGMRQELLALLKEKAYRRGHFRLASGGSSDYYLDAKRVTFHPRGAYLIARLFLDMIRDEDVAAVGGPSVGADPIAGAMAALSAAGPPYEPVGTFMVRSQAKDHGVTDRIHGTPLAGGDKVIIIDDVVTRGTSSLMAIEAVREAGCVVSKVLAVVDRMEGAAKRLAQEGCELVALFTARDFGHAPKDGSQ
ncbi:MAG: orotate phosphoribosyltransferase [Candidatus Omnitrophica bacterium]|nr:orotate phosphoribosyltransferase [Candidatus Omnitrophota bacterium]